MTTSTFTAAISCSNCGVHYRADLSTRRAIRMHDGRRVIPANGRIACEGCGSKHATYRTTEGGSI